MLYLFPVTIYALLSWHLFSFLFSRDCLPFQNKKKSS